MGWEEGWEEGGFEVSGSRSDLIREVKLALYVMAIAPRLLSSQLPSHPLLPLLQDMALLCMSTRPESLLLTHILVPPLCIRPSVVSETQAGRYIDICLAQVHQ